ncbi:MAG: glycosyl hydrolase family protein, partial [Hymenobacter sp.]
RYRLPAAYAQQKLRFDPRVWAENYRDDFSGPTLDRTEWDTSPDHNQNIDNHFGWGSEWYDFNDSSLVTIQHPAGSDGIACLTARRWLTAEGQPIEQPFGVYSDSSTRYVRYRSGMLVAKAGGHPDSPNWNNHSQQASYGAWEARLKLPANPNAWPAFWLWCSEVEIDLVDGVTTDSTSTPPGLLNNVIDNQYKVPGIRPRPAQHASERRAKVWVVPGQKPASAATLSDDFHTYTVVWTPKLVTFFFDGYELRSVPRSVVVTRLGYPLLMFTLQMQPWAGAEPTPDPNECAQMYIDWVRILKPRPDGRGQRNYNVAPSTYKTRE